jgi:hypothetical protein
MQHLLIFRVHSATPGRHCSRSRVRVEPPGDDQRYQQTVLVSIAHFTVLAIPNSMY